MLVRVRGPKGTVRIQELNETSAIETLYQKALENYDVDDENITTNLSFDPNGKDVIPPTGKTIGDVGIKHGDLIYVAQVEKQVESDSNLQPSPSEEQQKSDHSQLKDWERLSSSTPEPTNSAETSNSDTSSTAGHNHSADYLPPDVLKALTESDEGIPADLLEQLQGGNDAIPPELLNRFRQEDQALADEESGVRTADSRYTDRLIGSPEGHDMEDIWEDAADPIRLMQGARPLYRSIATVDPVSRWTGYEDPGYGGDDMFADNAFVDVNIPSEHDVGFEADDDELLAHAIQMSLQESTDPNTSEISDKIPKRPTRSPPPQPANRQEAGVQPSRSKYSNSMKRPANAGGERRETGTGSRSSHPPRPNPTLSQERAGSGHSSSQRSRANGGVPRQQVFVEGETEIRVTDYDTEFHKAHQKTITELKSCLAELGITLHGMTEKQELCDRLAKEKVKRYKEYEKELQKINQMPSSEIKKHLQKRGLPTDDIFEKQALAERLCRARMKSGNRRPPHADEVASVSKLPRTSFNNGSAKEPERTGSHGSRRNTEPSQMSEWTRKHREGDPFQFQQKPVAAPAPDRKGQRDPHQQARPKVNSSDLDALYNSGDSFPRREGSYDQKYNHKQQDVSGRTYEEVLAETNKRTKDTFEKITKRQSQSSSSDFDALHNSGASLPKVEGSSDQQYKALRNRHKSQIGPVRAYEADSDRHKPQTADSDRHKLQTVPIRAYEDSLNETDRRTKDIYEKSTKRQSQSRPAANTTIPPHAGHKPNEAMKPRLDIPQAAKLGPSFSWDGAEAYASTTRPSAHGQEYRRRASQPGRYLDQHVPNSGYETPPSTYETAGRGNIATDAFGGLNPSTPPYELHDFDQTSRFDDDTDMQAVLLESLKQIPETKHVEDTDLDEDLAIALALSANEMNSQT